MNEGPATLQMRDTLARQHEDLTTQIDSLAAELQERERILASLEDRRAEIEALQAHHSTFERGSP